MSTGCRAQAGALALGLALALFPPPGTAQVVFDGSLGPAGEAPLREDVPGLPPLPGILEDRVVVYDERVPNPADRHGRPAGGNLFQSLESLSVLQPVGACPVGVAYCRSVSFLALDTAGQPLAFDNVIARVTGGSASVIEGLLRSEVPGADLFLLNPAGILFRGRGEGSQLDVPGSVFLSTADTLRFSDGGEFAVEDAPPPALSFGDPTSFGFLGGGNGSITFQGSRAFEPPAGEDITIVASAVSLEAFPIDPGDPDSLLRSSQLRVDGGTARVAAVGGAAVDVPLALESWDVASMPDVLGEIAVTVDARLFNAPGSAGRVVLRGGRLVIDDSLVAGAGTTDVPALDVAMADEVVVRNDSRLYVDTALDTGLPSAGPGDPGIASGRIVTRRLEVSAGDEIGDLTHVGLLSSGEAVMGAFEIDAGSILVTDGGSILTQSKQRSPGGDLVIRAGEIEVRDGGVIASQADVSLAPGGDVDITTGTLLVTRSSDDAEIAAVTTESIGGREGAHAGDLRIVADEITVEAGSQISTVAGEFGDHGDVSIETGTLLVQSGGQVAASNETGRLGGDFFLGAETITVEDGGQVAARPAGGNAAFTIETGTLDVLSGGRIESANATDGGVAGTFTIDADAITVVGDGSRISSEASELGDGGGLVIAADTLSVRSGGQISTTTTTDRNGGDLSITATGDVLLVGDGSDVTGLFARSGSPSIGIGDGDGGSLTLSAQSLEMTGESAISTRSFGGGRSGELRVTALEQVQLTGDANGSPVISGRVFDGDGSLISVVAPRVELTSGGAIASSTFGLGAAGAIEIVADDVAIEGRDVSGNRSEVLSESVASPQRPEAGPGGPITLTVAGSLALRDGGRISSRSSSLGMGDAGDITLAVGGDVDLADAEVTAEAADASGGEITVTAGGEVQLLRSQLATSVLGRDGEGDGGNLTLEAPTIVQNASTLLARATRGDGGNITVRSETYLRSADSIVDASSSFGADGEVETPPPDVALKAALSRPPADYDDATALLKSHCAARAGTHGSFVVRARDGIAESPVRPLSPPLPLPSDVSPSAAFEIEAWSVASGDACPVTLDAEVSP